MKKSTFAAAFLLVVMLFGLWPVVQPVTAITRCDWVQFVADVSVSDGSVYKAGDSFNKVWRLKNIGTCTWNTAYSLVFVSGVQMSAPASIKLHKSVAPGGTIDLSVSMTAPNAAGTHQGNWQLKNASGVLFGIGANADRSFWVKINVSGGGGSTGYDFAANAASATWTSGAGTLSFPGTDGDSKGFAKKLDAPKLENGTTDTLPGLLMAPQNVTDGYIQGVFPAYRVGSGDRFQATVNCEYNATSCWANFRLQYQIGTGPVYTYWSFNEKYEGMVFRANVDLSRLAGQDVKFILRINAAGSAAGDRALWGSPRIISGGGIGPTFTRTPTVTGTPPTPTITPTVTPAASGCDKVQFVADVTVSDGSAFAPSTNFTKTWRIKNVGTCTFTNKYTLVFVSGDKLGGPDAVKFTSTIAPNTTFDISVNLTSPAANGSYKGFWQFKNEKGELFGIGTGYNKPFWVAIKVQGGITPLPTTPVPVGTGYDFAANAASAAWTSGAGTLTFPGTDGDAKGFAIKFDSIKMETGNTDNRTALLTFPQNVTDGYIQGQYPAVAIQSGDRFQATIGCQYGNNGCYIKYKLNYQIDNGTVKTFWSFNEKYEGMVYNVNLDLSSLAGQNVKFILVVSSVGSPSGDRAVWINPRITRPGGGTVITPTPVTPTVTPTPTATITSSNLSKDGLAYANPFFGYKFYYPKNASFGETPPNGAHISLPYLPGTNLEEKWLDVTSSQVEDASQCTVNAPNWEMRENVTINGIAFLHQVYDEHGASQIYNVYAYSTVLEKTCITFKMVLHSTNPGNYPTPPPVFNAAVETAVLTDMVSTFSWLTAYGVYGVKSNDTLNVRTAAGANNSIATTLPYDMPNVFRTGAKAMASSAEWWEIYQQDGETGWVNASYLTEKRSSASACNDARNNTLLANFASAIKNSNGNVFAGMVSPKHGLEVRYSTGDAPAIISKSAAAGIFTSTASYNWGTRPGSGLEVIGTFKDNIQPKLLDVLNANYQVTCNQPTTVGSIPNIWPVEYANIHFFSLYKPGTPGTELDWRYWLVGIEYVNGQPYIVALVQVLWAP